MNVSDAVAVGRKLWIRAWLRIGCELYCRATLRVVHPELALGIEKQVTGIGRPFIRGHVVTSDALLLALVFYLAEWWRKSLQLDFADQTLLSPVGASNVHNLAFPPVSSRLQNGVILFSGIQLIVSRGPPVVSPSAKIP